jgi:8-oxo-(d)GTP phosphatase
VLIKASGRWSFPKGSMERGEAPSVTALREIAEETGMPQERLRVVGQLPDVDYAFRWGRTLVFKRVYYFLVELTEAAALRPQLSEIEEVRWFGVAAARQAISFKKARETLDAAIARVDAQLLVS